MRAYRDRTCTDETITLDESDYINCHFVRCVLRYGGGPFGWHNSTAVQSRFELHGSALNTVKFLGFFQILRDVSEQYPAVPQSPIHDYFP